MAGDFENNTYSGAERAFQSFSKISKRAVVMSVSFMGLFILFVLSKFYFQTIPLLAEVLLALSTISLIFFYIFVFRAIHFSEKFYDIIGKPNLSGSIIIIRFVGPLIYGYIRKGAKKQMKEQLEMIR